jgi:hypothetical protein
MRVSRSLRRCNDHGRCGASRRADGSHRKGRIVMTREFVKMLAMSLTSVLLLFAAATLSAS